MTKEEAIKVASEMHGWLQTDREREALETLIPELAESEDERIRKGIVKFINEQYPEAWKDKKDKMLAYLEKQKEQKPAHTAKEMWKEMRLEVYAQASGNRHEPNYSDDSTKMFSLCDIDEIFEKIGNSTVGSQPVEWSEEDEQMLQSIIKDFRAGKVSTIGQEQWLKFLPKRFNLQPKQEWSEDDKHAIENCEYAIKETFKDEQNPHRIGTLDWLKSLRHQSKQEWSEEDEHRRTDAIYFLESAKSHYADTSEIEKTILWLKSLRPQPKRNCKDCAMFLNGKCTKPHWKPSDEQMDSLCATIVQTKGYSYSAYLPELYEQLKKL